ncbi:MAG: CDP-diacylglycerol-serine O-phosphatidyltransferase [uncultured bacterium]|nr:MAG: CDP-diacylglycerol-serine O-phosphatidyltransferase [uncultured bacterium]OGT16221.1 MAG: CDP-diacylglycerol--serine O-phosphatidyltransferase [Gammaproteobacteria bacterium RIFCSPHIGHO2_02_FULL_38_33]OGT24187.1 MAG: CDP-diacylglycerol--serine O-phosphatidyltransferase [Gammaproteobacteria bacterium RIFCSPHIGHO2_12_38_15]OGT69637.1 MAG: CDP-diacylglycerol--serine O-phosphatidyltransferase [Gammaproteobacteria bacterium RIFCSPLOWO2_02_FULL_38_11]OGT75486.1 MAG: CDP-diacylglycerol--serine
MTDKKDFFPNRPRGIYLLPNIFTSVSLFSGFYAIVAAMKGLFDLAPIAIFIAAISDSLDGRVARLTHTETAFGAHYDSLSDVVSFAVAPALLCYSWSLSYLGKPGWLVAFVFTAAVTLRLARFNTQLSTMDKGHFQGLPSPTGAGVVTAAVWSCYEYNFSGESMALLIAMLSIAVSALMVSNVRYRSFKDLNLKDRVPFVAILAIILILVGVAIAPAQVLFLFLVSYTISGPVLTLIELRKKRLKRRLGIRSE